MAWTVPSNCVPCIDNSISPPKSTRETDCEWVSSEGWQSTLSSPRKCERTVVVTEKKYEVPFSLSVFQRDINNERSDFKLAVALAYASHIADITLTYYATGTTAPVFKGRRRRRNLLQIPGQNIGSTCKVEASIKSFASIPLPADSTALAQLRITYPNLVQYNSGTPISSGSGFSLFGLSTRWFSMIGGSVGLVLCIILLFACCCSRKDPWESSDRDFGGCTQNQRSHTYRSMDRRGPLEHSPYQHNPQHGRKSYH